MMVFEMRILAFSERNVGLVAIFSAIAVLLSLVVIQASGARPYGEQAIFEQIDHEDGTLCKKFGFAAGTAESADCKLNLTDLRQRHVDLLKSKSWL
jgi:hypothetical protein